jgi:hypothetical protein
MKIHNYTPMIKTFGNGVQITFPNKYTVLIKNGIGAKCTQTKTANDVTDAMLAARFGGNYGPDVEVEIYDSSMKNISIHFGEEHSVGYVTVLELVNLLWVVSNLK